MINGIVGKVGGGKTVLSLYHMLRWLAKGGHVATNTELDRSKVAWVLARWRRRFYDDQIVDVDLRHDIRFHRYCGRGVVGMPVQCYLDEAHLHYGADDYKELTAEFKDIKSFVSQSRKVCVDVHFITQAWDNLWNQFRKHALYLYECRDMRGMQLGPLVNSTIAIPGLFEWNMIGLSWVKIDVASGQTLESGQSKLDRRILSCFNTAQVYDDLMAELMRTMPLREPYKDNKLTGSERRALLASLS